MKLAASFLWPVSIFFKKFYGKEAAGLTQVKKRVESIDLFLSHMEKCGFQHFFDKILLQSSAFHRKDVKTQECKLKLWLLCIKRPRNGKAIGIPGGNAGMRRSGIWHMHLGRWRVYSAVSGNTHH